MKISTMQFHKLDLQWTNQMPNLNTFKIVRCLRCLALGTNFKRLKNRPQ